GRISGSGRENGYVDPVVIDDDRSDEQFPVGHSELRKQTVVDDDIAGNRLDARGRYLSSELVEAGKRVGSGKDRASQAIGVVVVEVGIGHAIMAAIAAAHGQVALRHEDQITFQIS